MQEFLMDYGLWLLIGLLIVIGLVFLLSGRGKAAPVDPAEPVDTVLPVADPLQPVVAAIAPVEAVALTPAPVAQEAAPAPVPVTPRAAVPLTETGGDDLLRLKGVGPKLAVLLGELGVVRYTQIAAWTDADIAAIDARLGNFKGRPVRDQWVDQAKYLAAGDIAGFEAKYGKL